MPSNVSSGSSVPPPAPGRAARRRRSSLLASSAQRLAVALGAVLFLWMLTAWALQWW